ncbi:MAG TPA: DUF2946 family protein [Xanthobacteraceae bacterium]|nr:DUF2946 family protein [Xanthobacteraceae bacterium]
MGWVHGHRRRGAYLALAALVLQIAISFGHVDIDGIAGPDHLTLAGLHKTVAAKVSKHGPAQPSGDDDGYCPICASISLVSTSIVSEPPQLPVPDGFERVRPPVSIIRGIVPPWRVAFRSRAPPAA